MLELMQELEGVGYIVEKPNGEEFDIDFDTMEHSEWIKIKKGFIDDHIKKIESSDAILVANYTKDGKENYIGANTFMEIAFGYLLNKKIYLVNELPKQSNTEEIEAMVPIVLNGDIGNIRNSTSNI
jgi:hypothetical protein